jgi:hypothetical protein
MKKVCIFLLHVEFYVVSFLVFEAVEFATSDRAQYLSGSYTF